MRDSSPQKPRTNKYPPEGITLAMMLEDLVHVYGWERLGEKIRIRCFQENPSMKSSLNFLRKTEWAKLEVEALWKWRASTGWDPRDDHK